MALFKVVRQEDGVSTSYHRILYVMTTTNFRNSVAVASYVDEDARLDEKEHTIAQPYKKAVTYETEYDPTMTIESAYDFLKTLPEFEGATDI